MKLDLDALEKASLDAKYPSETAPVHENFLSLPTRKVTKTTIRINADETCLWPGNPRNFAVGVDISDLVPLIKKAKGNIQPVFGRRLDRPKDGVEVEIIAGCRRRLSCKETGELLTVDLIDINDEEARYLAELENQGRKDPDLITTCRYLKYLFDQKKQHSPDFTIEQFAVEEGTTRQTMTEKLRLADLPIWLLRSVKDSDSWTFRKGVKIKSLLSRHSDDIEGLTKDKVFANADSLVKQVESALEQNLTKKTLSTSVEGIAVNLATNKNGQTVLKLGKGIKPELLDALNQLIEDFRDK